MTDEDDVRHRAVIAAAKSTRYGPQWFTVSEHDVAKFASAIGARDLSYYEAGGPTELARPRLVAPRSFYMSLGTMRGKVLPRTGFSADGMPAEEQLAGSRLVVGGSSVRFFGEIVVGDRIHVEQEVKDVAERHGRSGPLVLIELERRYTRADGMPLVTETITRIVR
jgi:N-terminal half of MaoC dehydratase